MAYQVTFDYDPEPDLSWLEQWDTPAKYKGNEIIENDEPVSFERYLEYWGNSDRHVTLCMEVRHVREDGYENVIDTLCGIDYMDDQDYATGTFSFGSLDDVFKSRQLNDYQKDLVSDAIKSTDAA